MKSVDFGLAGEVTNTSARIFNQSCLKFEHGIIVNVRKSDEDQEPQVWMKVNSLENEGVREKFQTEKGYTIVGMHLK